MSEQISKTLPASWSTQPRLDRGFSQPLSEERKASNEAKRRDASLLHSYQTQKGGRTLSQLTDDDDEPCRVRSHPELGQTEQFRFSGKGVRRAHTTCVTRHRSHREAHLDPNVLTKLHNLHEFYMKARKPTHTPEDIDLKMCKAAFGRHGWQLHAVLPEGHSERPMRRRAIEFWGPSTLLEGVVPGAEADYFLKHWGAAMVNTKGRKEEDCVGQDNCSIATLADGWEVFCVCDGHGSDGHWPSTRASRTIPYFLQATGCAQMLKAGSFEAALRSAFDKVEKDLERTARSEDVRILESGCTATVAIRDKVSNVLWVATVGDSRAVLIVPGKGVVNSTRDHKPTLKEEKQRLEENGCVVEHEEYEDGEVEDRIYVAGEGYPGLNMTRSLGDVIVKDHGVTAEPEVVRWELGPWKTSYFLACSDGVWEFLPNHEVADFVLKGLEKGKSCREVVEDLLKVAQKKWMEYDTVYMDDITLLLVPLDDSTRPSRGLGTHLRLANECLGGCRKGWCRS